MELWTVVVSFYSDYTAFMYLSGGNVALDGRA